MNKIIKQYWYVILILTGIIALGIIVYIDYEEEYLNGQLFEKIDSKTHKYNLPEVVHDNSSTTIRIVESYNQALNLTQELEIKTKVTEKDFEKWNYMYIVDTGSSCKDSDKYEYTVLNQEKINVVISRNNCLCQTSSQRDYVYETPVPKSVTKNTKAIVSYLNMYDTTKTCSIK